ncbi:MULTISPECIES: Crp/Fnr family transcriptional regulator [Chryseobacterium]|uniref:CRP/FNR family transcriptional regulator n=1 Tax=Chryseobacterium camelliae TaxID=1265445 RepID=A0ABU0THZ1_9FLAO|nr:MULTISPECIES: Crp/Fnr family transcriptional regulator [Chryseobacterium]MDT3409460.1 CRP/FNR family transcriptional regulator [Pseudacidovorax intermedius]MDQ1096675.1 CRP/FNR family transcriptional regulator [Chryseobacterium camelliae]MDQ1100619.1 CRP/FNR family transcriptional regulator [Chryseobacterium sp. SORGH_AS_1048]MDR6087957.1 CRP/FNR family transcriptional regulator [Chryseobacterium sp. SORGH_AS_0909]MDR6132331.1 CRP/FNR family transcriptional regulator [Chryseobacterium sp. S
MFDILIQHIRQKVELNQEDITLLKTFFIQKKLNRKEFLLREGEICTHLAFVCNGILKSFTSDEKGQDRISLFAFEGWWISDFNSFINREKALLNINAIERSELLLISSDDYETLTLKIPVMDRYFRILYQNSLVTKDRRLIIFNKSTAEEKYLSLVQTHPDIFKRIPHALIASYLGLSPETVSRIRRKLLFQ